MRASPGLIRALGLFLPMLVLLFLWLRQEPERRVSVAALLGFLWNLPALLLLHLSAERFGWWSFQADGGTLLGMPIDLYLGWAVLWGPLPLLVFPRLSILPTLAIMLGVDLLLMPLCSPVLQLGENWLIGEGVAILLCLFPALLLGRWTVQRRRLSLRVFMQALMFVGLMLGLLPAVIIEQTGGSWRSLSDRSLWLNGVFLQLLAIPAVLGAAAAAEFARRGEGTPLPYDPPMRLVTSGPYAYVANPMQIAASLLLIGWGGMLESIWVAAAGLMCVAYTVGLARWDEEEDMLRRHGDRWRRYRAAAHPWLLRRRPALLPPARLYVSMECGICSEVGAWLSRRHPADLAILPAEEHPDRDLSRITYEADDMVDEGIVAFARALDHIDLRWAFVGWTIRLPLLRDLIRIVVDASGGGAFTVRRRASSPSVCSAAEDRSRGFDRA